MGHLVRTADATQVSYKGDTTKCGFTLFETTEMDDTILSYRIPDLV